MLRIENSVCPLFDIIPYLPEQLGDAVRLFCLKNEKTASEVTELRLRADGAFSLSVSDKNIFINRTGDITSSFMRCGAAELERCVALLCDGSYHSHTEEIKLGYVSTTGAYRAGVAPSASFGGGVYGVNSVCIRIPHDVSGCAQELLEQCGISSILIYSPPGVGKTTLLRDIIRICGSRVRTAVCDTRRELIPTAVCDTRRGSAQPHPPLADYISGLEKAEAIALATRTLSPQLIVCDEIGGEHEARAILSAQNTGVPFIATAHGASFAGIMSRPNIEILHRHGVFSYYVRISRAGGTYAYDIRKEEK